MHVDSIRIYPVKSLGGIAVESAVVEPWGLAGDRRFGLIDETGEKITAREVRGLLGLHAEPLGALAVRISDRAGSSIVVEAPVDAARVPVGHSRQGDAALADESAHAWLTQRAGRPVRLVWQDDPTVRSIDPERGGRPGEHLSLADAGPLLLASAASMAQLNAWIAEHAELPDVPDIDPDDVSGDGRTGRPEPLDIIRFRPNVIIDGDEPFAEDSWPGVRIGDVEFRTTMRCDRCVMTTIDPVTLAGGKEPIRTLARHRRWERKTWFGIRLVPLHAGTIRVGDPVTGVD